MSLNFSKRSLIAAGISLAAGLTIATAQIPVAESKPPVAVDETTPAIPAPAPIDPPTPAKAEPKVGPVIARVEYSVAVPADGVEMLRKAMTDARTTIGNARDYTCHLVREERVNGKSLPEQVVELRVRLKPRSVSLRVVKPKENAGQETCWIDGVNRVRFKPAGSKTFQSLFMDDAKLSADTRHSITEVGMMEVADRVDKILTTEKRLNHAVQVLVSDYVFQNKPVHRYEIFTDFPHPGRYAHRCVLFVDKESKLPVRFEAYEKPKTGGPQQGELIEVQSYIGVKFNAGLGNSDFDR